MLNIPSSKSSRPIRALASYHTRSLANVAGTRKPYQWFWGILFWIRGTARAIKSSPVRDERPRRNRVSLLIGYTSFLLPALGVILLQAGMQLPFSGVCAYLSLYDLRRGRVFLIVVERMQGADKWPFRLNARKLVRKRCMTTHSNDRGGPTPPVVKIGQSGPYACEKRGISLDRSASALSDRLFGSARPSLALRMQ